mgnify:FL=1
MKRIEIPVGTLDVATMSAGYADGIHFVIRLVREGKRFFEAPEARSALGSLADMLEGELPTLVKNYVETRTSQQTREAAEQDVTWN